MILTRKKDAESATPVLFDCSLSPEIPSEALVAWVTPARAVYINPIMAAGGLDDGTPDMPHTTEIIRCWGHMYVEATHLARMAPSSAKLIEQLRADALACYDEG